MKQARLVRNSDKTSHHAPLTSDVSSELIESTQKLWEGFKQASIAAGFPKAENYEWDWLAKLRDVDAKDARVYGIQFEGRLEGLMLVRIQPMASRIDPERCVIYVEYIESAPWNTPLYVDTQKVEYKGVGLSLLLAALEFSEESGCEGAIGLHSLPQAEGFYYRVNMRDFGIDAAENLRYFELSAEKAADLLQGD